jgi:hypothetical protein
VTYTSHGHHIPGTTRDDEFGQVDKARCGGVAICTVCQKDVARHIFPDSPDPDVEAHFEDTSEYDQDPDRFLKHAKLFVVGAYNNSIPDEQAQISIEDLYIVWFTYTLGNWKALVSTTRAADGLYFEVTHNGEKLETYVDTYLKIANDKFSQEGND